MLLGRLINLVVLLLALALAISGAALIAAGRSNAVGPDPSVALLSGLSFLLLAAPLFALPFSKRMFRALGILVLFRRLALFVVSALAGSKSSSHLSARCGSAGRSTCCPRGSSHAPSAFAIGCLGLRSGGRQAGVW
jgi:hypothetical protein